MERTCDVCGTVGGCFRPGKFEGNACYEQASRLYDIVLDGGADDECGSVAEDGVCYALVLDVENEATTFGARHALVVEDDRGFVSVETFETSTEARAEFLLCEQRIESAREEAEREHEREHDGDE